MKRLFLALILGVFSDPCVAQSDSPFDTLTVARGLSKMGNLSQSLMPSSSCQKFNAKDPTSLVSCKATSEDFEDAVVGKMEFDAGQVDPELRALMPEQFVKDTEGKKISCVFRFKMQNDNKQIIGCHDAHQKTEDTRCGDDGGRTHGLGITLSCASEDGISRFFDYSTELYSRLQINDHSRVWTSDGNGKYRVHQQFVSENIFSYIENNINQGKLSYWKRGVGFINLTEKKKWGLLQSTGQQKWFHETLNKIKEGSAITYKTEEGSMDKWGAFVNMGVGLQENLRVGGRCRVDLGGDIGLRAATLKNSNLWNMSSNAKMSFDLTEKNGIYLRTRAESFDRPGSSFVMEYTGAIGYERTQTGTFVEGGVTRQKGNREDVPDTRNFQNGKNDDLIFIHVGYGFSLK